MPKRFVVLLWFAVLGALAGCGGGGASAPAPIASSVPSTPVPIGFNDYVTFGFDNQRDVFNPNSTAITPAGLAGVHLGWQTTLDGGHDYDTQTQPVIATEIAGHAGVLFVGGGGSGNLYSYDALTGAPLWTRNLGTATVQCSPGVSYNFGIAGTVAYDPASRSLYVAGNANTTPNSPAVNSLFHLDATSGAVLSSMNFGAALAGPTEVNFTHTAVTLAGGVAYVGTSSTCDISSWRGRVAAIGVPTMTLLQTFFPVWNATTQPWGGGGVWGWGGVATDGAGNVLTGVGNADASAGTRGSIAAPFSSAPAENSGDAEALVELTPGLALEAAHHPIPSTIYNSTPYAADLDLNGTPVVFNPAGTACDTLAALQGKSGSLYVYDTLKIAAGPIAAYALAPPSYGDEFIGGPAYSRATGLLYATVPVGTGSLYPPGIIAIDPGCGSPAVAWHSTFGPDSDLNGGYAPRSVPAVTAGGVVFVGTPCIVTAAGTCTGSLTSAARSAKPQSARRTAVCCAAPSSAVGGALWALDAGSGAVLNGGNPILTTPSAIRVPPTVDGMWMYVMDNSGDLYALTIDPSVPTATATLRRAAATAPSPWSRKPPAAVP